MNKNQLLQAITDARKALAKVRQRNPDDYEGYASILQAIDTLDEIATATPFSAVATVRNANVYFNLHLDGKLFEYDEDEPYSIVWLNDQFREWLCEQCARRIDEGSFRGLVFDQKSGKDIRGGLTTKFVTVA